LRNGARGRRECCDRERKTAAGETKSWRALREGVRQEWRTTSRRQLVLERKRGFSSWPSHKRQPPTRLHEILQSPSRTPQKSAETAARAGMLRRRLRQKSDAAETPCSRARLPELLLYIFSFPNIYATEILGRYSVSCLLCLFKDKTSN
jgi:hypothetical protein